MIEKTLMTYLNEAISAPAYMEFPEDAPPEYVVLTKVGGGMVDLIQSSTIEFLCVSTSLQKAAELCEQLKTAMDGLTVLPEIARSRYAGDYNATFTASKSYRYKAVYEITHY